jgi:predicted HTH domain antitoxin
MTKPITIEVPEEAVRIFGDKNEKRFAREMAVVKWFDEGRISQGKAAELLEISRAELFDVLWRHKVSPIQVTPEELEEELKGA